MYFMLFIATDAEERVSIWEEKQSCTQQTAQMKSIVDDILVWRIDCLLANYDDKKGRPKFEIYVWLRTTECDFKSRTTISTSSTKRASPPLPALFIP